MKRRNNRVMNVTFYKSNIFNNRLELLNKFYTSVYKQTHIYFFLFFTKRIKLQINVACAVFIRLYVRYAFKCM